MSPKNVLPPNPPSQSLVDEDLGLTVIGPFKRALGNKVSAAKEWCHKCELLLQESENPEQDPTELEVQTMKEYVSKLHHHRNILKGIPREVEDKLATLAIQDTARRDEIAQGIEKHLEKAEFRRTLSKLTSTIGMFEQEFASRNIPMDDITRLIPTPDITDTVQLTEGEGIGNGSSGTTPRTYNSTHDRFLYDEVDYLDQTQDISYRKALEKQATEMLARQGKTTSNVSNSSEETPKVAEGLESLVETIKDQSRVESTHMEPTVGNTSHQQYPKVSPANSIKPPQNNVPEPKNPTASSTADNKQSIPQEFMKEIYSTIDRIQREKDNEHRKDMHNMFLELAAVREENQSLRMIMEQSKTDHANPSDKREYPTSSEKAYRNNKPEKKSATARLLFTSSEENSEGETDYDEQSSQFESDSEYRYSTGKEENMHRRNMSKKRIEKRPPAKPVKLDEIKKNLISFNGTGRFETFQTIFYEEVMENPNIKPFWKAVLLDQNLKGAASRYFYQIEDPTESIRKTFADLKKKFGRKTNEMSLHEKFSSLPFHKFDCEQMVTDVADHRKVLAQLEERKININDTRSITAFTKKLPRVLCDKVLRYLTKTSSTNVNFERVLDIVEAEIDVLHTTKAVFGEQKTQGSNEMTEPTETTIHYANTQSHQNNRQYQQNIGGYQQGHQNSNHQNSRPRGNPNQKGSHNGNHNNHPHPSHKSNGNVKEPNWSIVVWSFPFGTAEKGKKCAACDGPHNAIRCPLSSTEFKKRIQAKNLCERCTRGDHTTEQCRRAYKCGYCHGDHAMGACHLKEKYRNRANIPAQYAIKDENSPKRPFRKQGNRGNSQ